MRNWSRDELNKIGDAEELSIASRRGDGTLKKPVIIWVVRVDNDLYVRSVNGRGSGWFRGVLVQHQGQISAGGVEKDVAFVEITDLALLERVDEAYRVKYRRYPQWVAPLFKPEAVAATIRLDPLDR